MELAEDMGPMAVIGVLMEYGLPEEIARDIVYRHRGMLHPLTHAYRTAWEPAIYKREFQQVIGYVWGTLQPGGAWTAGKARWEGLCLCMSRGTRLLRCL